MTNIADILDQFPPRPISHRGAGVSVPLSLTPTHSKQEL
jgi:hypothetical protein